MRPTDGRATTRKRKVYDRFIPDRAATNMQISALNLEDDLSGHTTPFHAALGKAVLDEYSVATVPIIEFRKRNKGLSPSKLPRALGEPSASLPSSPVIYRPKKSLDAPNLLDDYYTNALTWVSVDTFAVALGPAVYLYNTRTNLISELTTLRGDAVAATSLLHLPPGDLAIGTSRGHTEIWDVAAERIKVRYRSHNFRVGSLASDGSILTSGVDGLEDHPPRYAHGPLSAVGDARGPFWRGVWVAVVERWHVPGVRGQRPPRVRLEKGLQQPAPVSAAHDPRSLRRSQGARLAAAWTECSAGDGRRT